MAISNFKLDCCRLFDLFPLYARRKRIGDSDKYRLHVFIMGFGERMETIFNAVLTQGQLLDTELYVTVAVPNPSLFTDKLIESAPALPNFARITCLAIYIWTVLAFKSIKKERCSIIVTLQKPGASAPNRSLRSCPRRIDASKL